MERILLVDDERLNRTLVGTQLQHAGYAVDEADDGREAWAMLNGTAAYSVVVTDWRMPNLDGLELFKLMQNSEQLRQIPVILQTGADSPEEVEQGIRAGVYYYLVKPFQKEALLTLVKSAISERRKNEVMEGRLSTQTSALATLVKGSFQIGTLENAQDLAYLLGCLFPRPELAVAGLYELLLNAIEHGNLGVGFEEKARLLAEGDWEAAVRKRLALPANANKKVDVQFAQSADRIEVLIADSGPGFDWRPFLEIEPSRATQANGRGIAKANLLSFDKLTSRQRQSRAHLQQPELSQPLRAP